MIAEREENTLCTGCELCLNICPVGAIKMHEDQQGFLYPAVEKEKCINCNLCEKRCPVRKEEQKQEDICVQRYYAAQIKDNQVLMKSSSGGICFGISQYVIGRGGVVYGVTLNEFYEIVYDRVSCFDDIYNILGSKYVQTNIDSIYKEIENDIKRDLEIAVFGNPCLIDAIKDFIVIKGYNLDKILFCDFVCHGVTSPKIWEEYVKYLGLSGEKYNFRGKSNGWNHWSPEVQKVDGSLSSVLNNKMNYIKLYQTAYITREGCFSCKYCTYERKSDITMGDFWNIGNCFPRMDNDKGTSQVLVNTMKGFELWNEICKDFVYTECKKEDVWQPHLEYPTNVNMEKREKFWQDYQKISFEQLMEKYRKGSLMGKCKDIFVPFARKTGLYVFLGKLYRRIFVS